MVSTKSYRIGIDARSFRSGMGGIGRYTRHLVQSLANIDQNNEYFVFLTPLDMPEWNINQANIHPVEVDVVKFTIGEQTSFLGVLNRYTLDLVHFLNFNHPVMYKRPFVTTLHDLTVFHRPDGPRQSSLLKRLAFLYTFERALKSACKVIAISQYTLSDAAKSLKLDQNHMTVIYEGGPAPIDAHLDHREQVQNYLGNKEPYILFVSEWRPHKGILTLIDAFAKFKSDTALPHKLVLLGEQKMIAPKVMEKLVSSPVATDIVTPGFAPGDLLPFLYHNAACHVVPSEHEGFGLTVLEAFAAETPVIVANNSSLPEVAGDAALYFETGSVGALARSFRTLLGDSNLAEELRRKGKTQLEKFSWDRMARQTLETYVEVCTRTN